MGRALSRYVPLDMAILSVIELILSFMVIHFMLEMPAISVPLASAGALADGTRLSFGRHGNDLAAILAIVVIGVTVMTGFRYPEICLDRRRLLVSVCIAGVVAFPMFLLMSGGFVQGSATVRILWLTKILGVWVVTIALFRLLFSFAVRRTVLTRRILIVGDPRRADAVTARLHGRLGRRFEPLTTHATTLSWDLLREQQVWGVVVAPFAEPAVAERLLDYKLRGMKVISDVTFQEQHLGRIDPDAVTLNDLLLSGGFAAGRLSAAVKRGCDVVISLGMMVVTLPMMALTALVIKIDSPGPVLYRQQRIGYLGQPFTLLKFRSMTVDAEAGGDPRWAQKQDPRTTRIGNFIRTTRIDELPQLANVMRGEMSLVGPRPERPHFVEQLARAIPFYRERSYVKPGLTGWAQINFPYGASIEDAREKLAYDLYYTKHRGVLLDLVILISTIRVVLCREGGR
jgi:exopolysaccharide biosynthesis polyprenyl glycosylphosphotransferase